MTAEICAGWVKGCARCGEEKPLSEFYVWRGRVMGRCKGCVAAADRRRYQDPVGAYRAKQLRNAAKWKAQNPEKLRAQRVIDNEVRKGRLERQPCGVCGAKAHAHHADYAQPLAVQWLCPLHHARQHAVEGRLGR